MSVASEILRLQNAKAALKTSIEKKGVNVSASATIDDYAALVDAIPILPLAYTQLAYIESSGTQYINTGIIPTMADETEVYLKMAYVSATTSIGIGAWNNLVATIGNSKWRLNGVYTSVSPVTNDIVEIILKQTSSGRYYSISSESGYGSKTNVSNNFCLGIIGGSSTYTMAAKFYKCTIKNSNVLVRDFIPAKRNSDNEIGMYDKVSGTFYTNGGTGTFSYGVL